MHVAYTHVSVNWKLVLWIQKFITEETTTSNFAINFIIYHVCNCFANSTCKPISQNCCPYIIRLAKEVYQVICQEMKVQLCSWPLLLTQADNLLPMAIYV